MHTDLAGIGRAAKDGPFVNRALAAAVEHSRAVLQEAGTGPAREKRWALAARVLANPEVAWQPLSWAIATEVDASATDAQVRAAVAAVWDDLAGVTPVDETTTGA